MTYRPCAGCDTVGASCRAVGCPAARDQPSPAAQPRTSQKIRQVFNTMQQWWCGTFLRHRGPKIRVFDKVELLHSGKGTGLDFWEFHLGVTKQHERCKRCGKDLPPPQWGVGPYMEEKWWPNFRDRLRRFVMCRVIYRAGYADRQNPRYPFRRYGKGWLRIGPYVVGNINAWASSDAP